MKTDAPLFSRPAILCVLLSGLLLTACEQQPPPPSPQTPPKAQEPLPVTSARPEILTPGEPPSTQEATTHRIAQERTEAAQHPYRLLLPASANVENCAWLPFYKAVPLSRGELTPAQAISARIAGEPLPAILTPLSFWDDGSIRWLGVDGIMPRHLLEQHGEKPANPAFQTALAFNIIKDELSLATRSSSYVAPKPQTDPVSGAIHWHSPTHGRLLSLSPAASVITVTAPKKKEQLDPVALDTRGQFAWAEGLKALAPTGSPIPLTPKVLKTEIEQETPLYTLYKFYGHGGSDSLGKELEWLLRAKVYKAQPLIRLSITWIPRWNPEKQALASAKWHITTPQIWSRTTPLGGALTAEKEPYILRTAENGSHIVETGGRSHQISNPTLDHDGVLLTEAAETPKRLAIAIPDFTKHGPGHLKVDGNQIEIASWSELSQKALDLRQSGEKEAFGINEVDLPSNGSALSHTLEASVIFVDNEDEGQPLARYEAGRDSLWFASSADLERTSVLGPMSLSILSEQIESVRAIHANILFLVRARDYWKWYGFANYGDYRTNFALGTDRRRGLNAGHWALHGRYGWRNASGSINYSLIRAGFMLNDREILLAGIQHAAHVVNIDTKHPSFFSAAKNDEGGMHRRNRDHWSGNTQVQYSPTKGIYLAQWLTNDQRMKDVLGETRAYVSRDGGRSSAFSAQAWIIRYSETHSPEDYAKAKSFLDGHAAWWAETAKHPTLRGHAALYANNFRRISDGLETLIQFHQITNEPRYLQSIKESVIAHGLPAGFNGSPGVPYTIAYLLANGVSEDEIGPPLIEGARGLLKQIRPDSMPEPTTASYEELIRLTTSHLPPIGSPAYRESASIAGRATYGFLALQYLGEEAPHALEPTSSVSTP